MPVEMKKFGFRIRTRGGSVVENLTIQGRDREEAERKLRQVYHHCVVLEASEMMGAAPADASDFEGLITLIADEGRRGDG
ncbi:MAG: hypothetical protein K8F93_06500 [Burkholderiales bacterium]|nr:hypothetical protein [Burkholderiales bacterium]MBX3716859.1 hypothetical protein [Burkholderiales bacterium]MBZ0249291.1 hypothetical protein [Burkholderiales bacterium]MCL4690663.1 hypothetical protein [Burkholderiales bacterium]